MAASSNNAFVDLSGVSTADFDNPYDALIAASNDDPVGGVVTENIGHV